MILPLVTLGDTTEKVVSPFNQLISFMNEQKVTRDTTFLPLL